MGEENPARTVQTFIDLVGRHEQAFYLFVHKVHSKGEGLFNSLTQWVELFLTFMREGLGEPISLDYLLPHSDAERAAILKEVDAVALYHYKLKVAHEEKVKRRFDSRVKDELDNAEEEAAQDLVEGVMGDLSIGELVQGELSDLDPSDSSEDDYDSTEEESSRDEHHHQHHNVRQIPQSRRSVPERSSTATSASSRTAEKSLPQLPQDIGSPPPPPPPKDVGTPASARTSGENTPRRRKTLEALHLKSGSGGSRASPQPSPALRSAKRKRRGVILKEPELKIIPDLLPIFLEVVSASPFHAICQRLNRGMRQIRPKLRPRQAAPS